MYVGVITDENFVCYLLLSNKLFLVFLKFKLNIAVQMLDKQYMSVKTEWWEHACVQNKIFTKK